MPKHATATETLDLYGVRSIDDITGDITDLSVSTPIEPKHRNPQAILHRKETLSQIYLDNKLLAVDTKKSKRK